MNAEESAALAQAFVSEAFLEAQVERKPGALYLMRRYYIHSKNESPGSPDSADNL